MLIEQANLRPYSHGLDPCLKLELEGETWRVILRKQVINSKLERRLLPSLLAINGCIKYWTHRGRMLPHTSQRNSLASLCQRHQTPAYI